MKKLLLLTAVLAVIAAPRVAQAQAITSYTLVVTPQGSSTVVSTTVLPASVVQCNLTPLPAPSGTVVNPTHIEVNDPVNAGQACTYTDPGTGPLASLPFGSTVYTATLAATNSAGTSPPSAVSNPFSHPGVAPAAPTGLVVAK